MVSFYLAPEFYICFSVGSESKGNSMAGSETVLNNFIGHINQVWTFTLLRWAALLETCIKETVLQFTIKKKFNRQQY